MSDGTRIRLTNTLFASQSLLTASQIAIFTLMSIVAADLSGRESAAGLPSTMLTLSQSAMALPIGIFMGRFGRRLGLTVSYSMSLAGALIGLFALLQGSFLLLLVSSMAIGAGRAGADQGRYAAGDMFPDGMRARMIGRVVFAGTIGAIAGPLLVGPATRLAPLVGLPPNAGPWMIGSVLYTVAIAVAFFMLRPEPMTLAYVDEEKPKRKQKNDETIRPIWELLRLPRVQLAVVSLMVSQSVMVALMVITPLHMVHHDHSNDAVSIVIMAHTLGMFGLSSLTGRLIDRYGTVRVMVLAAFTLIASAVIAPMSATMPVLIIALFLLGLGWNFGYIAGSSLLSQALQDEERARMQGASDMMVAGAAAIGSFSSGPLFGVGGYVAVAAVGVIVTLLFGWVIYLIETSQQVQQLA